jgi:hypothetical protein
MCFESSLPDLREGGQESIVGAAGAVRKVGARSCRGCGEQGSGAGGLVSELLSGRSAKQGERVGLELAAVEGDGCCAETACTEREKQEHQALLHVSP